MLRQGEWSVDTNWTDPITPLSAMLGLVRLDLLQLDLNFGLSTLLSLVTPMTGLQHLSLSYFPSANVSLTMLVY